MQRVAVYACLQGSHLGGLEPLWPLLHSELYAIILAQRAEPIPLYCRVVDEHVLSGVAGDKAITCQKSQTIQGQQHHTYMNQAGAGRHRQASPARRRISMDTLPAPIMLADTIGKEPIWTS